MVTHLKPHQRFLHRLHHSSSGIVAVLSTLLLYLCIRFLATKHSSLLEEKAVLNLAPRSQDRLQLRSPPRCNYSNGRWVRHHRAPQYNDATCIFIKDSERCTVNGRNETGYLHWRWQPRDGGGCDLPTFDATAFLRLIANKSVAFVGESLNRNQMESLLCLLSAASPPELVYEKEGNKFRRFAFRAYNATVSSLWAPFLLKAVEKLPGSGVTHNKLFIDALDERWLSHLDDIDVVLFYAGHWFIQPAVYYQGGQPLGCHLCPKLNGTAEIDFMDIFRTAIRTTLREVRRRRTVSRAVVVTFSPAHFDGEWDKAGACRRTEPYGEGAKRMDDIAAGLRRIAVEEVATAAAAEAESGGGVRVEVLDVTQLAFMRPDGHPGPYMHPNPFANGYVERVQNDCLHWCSPGVIDTWNEILLTMMRRWRDEERR